MSHEENLRQLSTLLVVVSCAAVLVVVFFPHKFYKYAITAQVIAFLSFILSLFLGW